MSDHKSFVSTLWLTSSLALLASILVAPVQTSGLFCISARPAQLGDNFDLSPGHSSTCIHAATTTDAVQEVNALPVETEEQDPADAPDDSRVSLLIPCSFRKLLDRRLIAPRSILSLYPLRC